MPLTQAQMIEQMQESRANHQEMKALRTLILNYIGHLQATYPKNQELMESMSALSITIQMRTIPDDRATYMNEKYYARFAKRNATAKQRQAMIRAGVIIPRARGTYQNKDGGIADPDVGFRNNPGKTHVRQAPIMPRDYPDDKPLEFETVAELPKPQAPQAPLQEKLALAPSFTLDEPEDKY